MFSKSIFLNMFVVFSCGPLLFIASFLLFRLAGVPSLFTWLPLDSRGPWPRSGFFQMAHNLKIVRAQHTTFHTIQFTEPGLNRTHDLLISRFCCKAVMYFLCLTFVNSIKLRYIFEDPVRSIQFFLDLVFKDRFVYLV
jgi:hypothetical protein